MVLIYYIYLFDGYYHALLFVFRDDFFLISQSVNQGTVGPTHYVIVSSGVEALTKERLYMLTYKLCHMYYNWLVSMLKRMVYFGLLWIVLYLSHYYVLSIFIDLSDTFFVGNCPGARTMPICS